MEKMKLSGPFLLIWWGAVITTSLIVILATLPPFLPAEWRALLMVSFSTICHQIPERSPHINGVALGVCHRCYGVYLGLPVAALGFLFFSRLNIGSTMLRLLLFGSLGLLAIDWGAPLLNLWHNTPTTRMATGLLFGLTAGYYLVHVLHQQGNGAGDHVIASDIVK